MKKLTVLAAIFATSLLAAPLAQAASDQQQAVDEAAQVVEHLRSGNDDIARQARDLMHKARAVLIVPELVKGGFIIGGQGGTGVLVARSGQNDWSAPAFFMMGAGSIGLQIGVEISKVVLIVMSDHALDALMKNKVKLGAEAGMAIATVGAGGEASTTTHGGADIYVIAESKGLFGGIAIQGGVVEPRKEWNAAYYGPNTTTRDIIIRRKVANPGTAGLQHTLDML